MQSEDLIPIRLKYFGNFIVFPGRAKSQLIRLNKLFAAHKIDSKEYFRIKKMIETFLEKQEDND